MHRVTIDRLNRLRSFTAPYGVFTATQASECGISRWMLQRFVREGLLMRNTFERGVYRFDTPAEHESIVDAALVAGPEAVVSHVSALALHGLTDLIPSADEFTLPRTRRSRRPPNHLKFHFTAIPLLERDITELYGVRVTTPARALVDAARTTGRPDQIERGIRDALSRGVATEAELSDVLDRTRLRSAHRRWFASEIERAATEIRTGH